MQFWWVFEDSDRVVPVHDGVNTFFVAATGLGIAPVSRRIERGSEQHGVTDRGFRFEPRTITIGLLLKADTLAEVDELRDDLAYLLTPKKDVQMSLRVERDDGQFRQIDCALMDIADFPVAPTEARMGASQTVAITLFCADPLWYDPNDTGGDMLIGTYNWWTGFGSIDNARAVYKSTGAITSDTDPDGATVSGLTVLDGKPFTIYVRVDPGAVVANSTLFEFEGQSALSPNKTTMRAYLNANLNSDNVTPLTIKYNAWPTTPVTWDSFWPTGGYAHYFYLFGGNSPGYVLSDSRAELKAIIAYGDTVPLYQPVGLSLIGDAKNRVTYGISSGQWFSNIAKTFDFAGTISHAAIYDTFLNREQRDSLVRAVRENAAFLPASPFAFDVDYQGNVEEYPIIEIYGPITNPVLTNTTTGEKLDFTGYTIPAGGGRIIDCRYGYKTVFGTGGTNRISQLSADSNLATFHLAPGGINSFTLGGSSTSSDTEVYLYYKNRYSHL